MYILNYYIYIATYITFEILEHNIANWHGGDIAKLI